MKYPIAYDLKRTPQNYKMLYLAYKVFGNWPHRIGFTRLFDSNLDAVAVWKRIRLQINNHNFLPVIGVELHFWGRLLQQPWNCIINYQIKTRAKF